MYVNNRTIIRAAVTFALSVMHVMGIQSAVAERSQTVGGG